MEKGREREKETAKVRINRARAMAAVKMEPIRQVVFWIVYSDGNRSRGAGQNFGGDDRNRGGQPQPSTGNANQGARPLFFNQEEERREPGPITGEDYKEWADRLGNVEEMVDREDIRNGIAKVLDDARAMKIDYERDNLPATGRHDWSENR